MAIKTKIWNKSWDKDLYTVIEKTEGFINIIPTMYSGGMTQQKIQEAIIVYNE